MTTFDQILSRLPPGESQTLRELDKRFAMAQALLHKLVPDLQPAGADYAKVLVEYFDCVDEALDALDDDDDEDD